MMTQGRLRVIESYMKRDGTSRDILLKCGGELVAEVKRLRETLDVLKTRCGEQIGLAAKNDSPVVSVLIYVSDFAAAALAEPEPDHGPPDIVCRRDESDRFNVVLKDE